MADEMDRAQAQEERMREAALMQRRPAAPAATGACLHCDEPLAAGRRWCDVQCRDDWQRDQRRAAR